MKPQVQPPSTTKNQKLITGRENESRGKERAEEAKVFEWIL
jgi:hypothetical protein